MVRDPFGDEGPDLQEVLDALDDPDCREFVRALEEPMTASELSEACDVPLSTTYRKLDLLTEASLLDERTEIRTDGRHTTRYAVEFEVVRIGLDDERQFDLQIQRPERTTDQRLAAIWSEVRKET
jgi:DNA-binding transcriptional ArsR family regulator